MFGDLTGMMGKLKETQQKIQETKTRLNSVILTEKSGDDLIQVNITANRELKSIALDERLLQDKEQLEDYLVCYINKAIAQAGKVNETELGAVAKDGMPDIPGMDMFK